MTLAEILGTAVSAIFVISGVWLIMDAIASAKKRAERNALMEKVNDIYKDRSPFPLKNDDIPEGNLRVSTEDSKRS